MIAEAVVEAAEEHQEEVVGHPEEEQEPKEAQRPSL